jgi:hypothetical protein
MSTQTIGRFFSSRTGRLIVAIVSFCLLFIVLIWSQIATQLKTDKEQAIASAVQRNSNLAVSLEQYAIRTIRNADAVLQLAKKEYEERGKGIDFNELFGKGIIDTNYFNGIAIVDEAGRIVVSNLSVSDTASYEFSDRKYFRFHKTHSDSLHISEPLTSRIINKPVIVVSRRMNHPDGSFAGVVAVQIEPSTFTRFYASANLRS